MLDLIIKNGTIITSDETFKGDIGIEGEKISCIGFPGKLDDLVNRDERKGSLTRVIDAKGRYVMPGFIEPHMHVKAPFSGTIDMLDFYTASKCAAFGGVTSFMDFSTTTQEVPVLEAVEDRLREMAEESVLDYCLHPKFIHAGKNEGELRAVIKAFVARGVPAFKMFTIYPGVMIQDADILRIMKLSKEEGALCGFHAESNDIAQFMTENLIEEEKKSWEYFNQAKPNACEAEAVSRIIQFAELLDAPVYFYHLSTKEAVEAVRQAKHRGLKVYAETCGHYLTLTDERNKGENGIHYLMSPPLRSETDRRAMWDGLRDGSLSLVTSDNEVFGRCIKEKDLEKDQKGDVIPDFRIPVNGIPGLEERFGLLMIGVNRGEISLNQLVQLGSTNPARIFGCYPQKGSLEVGSDADIIIVDPEKEVPLTWENLHYPPELDYSIYEGFVSRGWPVCTIRRGEILVEDGQFKGEKGSGQFLKCKIEL